LAWHQAVSSAAGETILYTLDGFIAHWVGDEDFEAASSPQFLTGPISPQVESKWFVSNADRGYIPRAMDLTEQPFK
jgi:hypothetical protein